MKITHRLAGAVAIAACALAVASAPILAADDTTGWSDKAEMSYVVTAGNSETTTLGLKNTLTRAWEKSAFTLKAGAIRADSTRTSTFAVGLVDDFAVREDSVTEKTAENYYINGRYERKIHERLYWYGSAGWERNIFAGIDNRYSAQAGVGNIWVDRDDLKFKTDYALTYTDQKDVVEVADRDSKFLGARFAWAYLHKFGKNTTYENLLALDMNLSR
jgi:putative salt-induced outer membrane protein YdiY